MEWTRQAFGETSLPPHIWLGVSVENQDYVWRIEQLQQAPAKVRFLSVEPLLGPVDLSGHLKGIHWVIVGGESGPGARPMDPDWARIVRRQCQAHKVAFFFKQWGAFNKDGERAGKKTAGRVLDGRTWDGMPRVKAVERQLAFA